MSDRSADRETERAPETRITAGDPGREEREDELIRKSVSLSIFSALFPAFQLSDVL